MPDDVAIESIEYDFCLILGLLPGSSLYMSSQEVL